MMSAITPTATPIVEKAWQRGAALALHGWLYGMDDGLLRDLGPTLTTIADRAGVQPGHGHTHGHAHGHTTHASTSTHRSHHNAFGRTL